MFADSFGLEHVSKSSGHDSNFLNGLSFAGIPKPNNNAVIHDDELAYLFDVHKIHGKQLKKLIFKHQMTPIRKFEIFFSNLIT